MANSAFDHSPTITMPGSSTNTAIIRWNGTGANGFLDSTLLLSTSATPTLGIAADPDLLTFGDGTLAITGTVTGVTTITATTFSGALSGNATSATALQNARTIGGTSFDGSANIAVALATTATTLASARTIGGTSFDGSANIVPATITVADTTDTTSFVGLWESATGDLAPKTDAALTYNAGTGALTATTFHGSGANLTNLPAAGASLSGSTNNTIVTVTGANAMQGEAKLTYDGDGMLTMSNSSGSNNWLNHATATSGTANPSRLILRTASGNAGDTYISFHGVDTYEYSVGVDTSDVGSGGRRFKISGSALGTNDKLTLQPDGRFVINPTSGTNPVGSGPFAIKAFSSNDVNLEMYCAGSDEDAGYRIRTFERGSGGSSGSHSYVSQSAVQIMTSGGAGSRGAIVWVHGEQDGDTNTFTDMVVVPVTGGFSNNTYSASGSSVGSGNVIFRLNVRGSPANRTYSLGATNTLYLAMSSGNYNVVTMCMGVSGLAT